ncbi:bursicon-like [Oscarella lobularis]|uniref:bursicon-like n=1 Tax=Oscarella lobularis TaxID=121494 RepID=UPI0033135C9E
MYYRQILFVCLLITLVAEIESRATKKRAIVARKTTRRDVKSGSEASAGVGRMMFPMDLEALVTPPKRDDTTCQPSNLWIDVGRRGCQMRTVRAKACKGVCDSYHTSDWNGNYFRRTCKCCVPVKMKERTVKLRCPGQSPHRVTFYEAAECACRRECLA